MRWCRTTGPETKIARHTMIKCFESLKMVTSMRMESSRGMIWDPSCQFKVLTLQNIFHHLQRGWRQAERWDFMKSIFCLNAFSQLNTPNKAFQKQSMFEKTHIEAHKTYLNDKLQLKLVGARTAYLCYITACHKGHDEEVLRLREKACFCNNPATTHSYLISLIELLYSPFSADPGMLRQPGFLFDRQIDMRWWFNKPRSSIARIGC